MGEVVLLQRMVFVYCGLGNPEIVFSFVYTLYNLYSI